MTIPAPLAYPPTALRNVAAGLVVGNPIGSSGTRAKALTSAELKAIVEASGISYLPLSGGTLTGPITGTGGLIEQRDGLTAQCFDLFETYTSGTNNGKLRFKATSSGHQIGSARATSGSNRAVQLGHFDAAGTFTAGLSIGTDGTPTASATTGTGPSASTEYLLKNASGAGIGSASGGHGSGALILTASGTIIASVVNSTTRGFMVRSDMPIGFCTNNSPSGFDPDAYWVRLAAGSIGVKGASGVNGSMTMGDLTLSPSSSRTLATNGQFSIEMTSNTAGNLVYRGSDGTTRRMALTFS